MGNEMKQVEYANPIDSDKGAVTLIEAVIVFPIMFFIVFIMMMAGNAYYQKARVERAVVECTLDAASRCTNPFLGYVIEHDTVPHGTKDVEIYPYRYIFPKEMKNIAAQLESELSNRICHMNSIAFKGMEPKVISPPKLDLNWYLIASYIDTECSFKVQFPIRVPFSHENVALRYYVHLREPVGDAPNLIRNTSMTEDYIERFAGKYRDKFIEIRQKIEDITDIFR